jgi:hypothetical protein
MAQPTTERNPFMLLVNPQEVITAVEKSERLGRLNRHLCRPLDRPTPTSVRAPGVLDDAADEGGDDEVSDADGTTPAA